MSLVRKRYYYVLLRHKIKQKNSLAKLYFKASHETYLFLNELILELTEINPREFFGQGNENINLLKKYFPKLKIVARGNKIKVYGDEELLEEARTCESLCRQLKWWMTTQTLALLKGEWAESNGFGPKKQQILHPDIMAVVEKTQSLWQHRD